MNCRCTTSSENVLTEKSGGCGQKKQLYVQMISDQVITHSSSHQMYGCSQSWVAFHLGHSLWIVTTECLTHGSPLVSAAGAL